MSGSGKEILQEKDLSLAEMAEKPQQTKPQGLNSPVNGEQLRGRTGSQIIPWDALIYLDQNNLADISFQRALITFFILPVHKIRLKHTAQIAYHSPKNANQLQTSKSRLEPQPGKVRKQCQCIENYYLLVSEITLAFP